MIRLFWLLIVFFFSQTISAQQAVNVYTHRHYDADRLLFERFTEQTGIRVNVVSAAADQLIKRLELEGVHSPADVLITVDISRLHQAKTLGLLQPVQSDTLSANIPAHLRDPEGHWFGLTRRARIIVYAKDRVDPSELSTYEDLTAPKWRNRLLVRPSDNTYNQSLLASIIAHHGVDDARAWAQGIVANLARPPRGNDRDQIKAIASGTGDIAIVNTYYIGLLMASDNAAERQAAEKIGVFFPNQQDRGAHINISGAGVTAHAPNRDNAIALLKYLSGDHAQQIFAESNFEYPVKPDVAWAPLLTAWGTFKADTLSLERLGKLNTQAVRTFDEARWR